MAAAFVQGDRGRDGTGTVSTITEQLVGVAGGNTLICVVGTDDATKTLTSLKDDLNNSFTITPGSPYSGVQRMWIGYLSNVTAGTRIATAIWSGNAAVTIFMCEVSGLATSSPLDVEAGQAFVGADGTHIVLPALTTTKDGDFLFEASIAPNITSVGNGWTLSGTIVSGCAAAYKVTGTAGSYPADFTSSITGNWEVVVAAFKTPGTAYSVSIRP